MAFWSTAALLCLTACGAAVSDLGPSAVVTAQTSVATGYIKDSTVKGLHYESGSTIGITDEYGKYQYEVAQNIVFSIGGVTLPPVTANKFSVTPVSMVPNSGSATTEVLNITRFLLMLDDNGNPDDGIVISPQVQNIADSWSQVNFTTTNLPAELTGIISDAASVDGGPHVLPDEATARTHLESTLQCLHSGVFQGRLVGGNIGRFAIFFDANTGTVSGRAYHSINAITEPRDLTGTTTLDFSQPQVGLAAVDSAGAQYFMHFTTLNQVDGNWTPLSGQASTMSGGRVGGAAGAIYRMSGRFDGDDEGVFSVSLPITGQMTGQMYSIKSDFVQTVNGSVDQNILTFIGEDGSTVFTGTLDATTGTLSGAWNNQFADPNNPNFGGSFSGTGCRLIP